MTRILHFAVSGLAGRSEPYEVELSSDVNVFFGLNGSGKTTLLKILYAAVRNDHQLVNTIPFQSASVTFYSEARASQITRTISKSRKSGAAEHYEMIEFADGASEMVRVAEEKMVWASKPRDQRRYAATYLSIARLLGSHVQNRYLYAHPGEEWDAEVLLNETFVREVSTLWRRYTTKLLSDVRQVQEQGLAEIMQSLFSSRAPRDYPVVDAQTAFARTNDFLLRQGANRIGTFNTFRKRYDEEPRLRSVVGNIDKIERDIEVAEEPRRRLETLVSAFVSGPKEIVFTDSEISVSADGKSIPLGSLSSGEKQLLRILVETINAGNSVVIIDEPELSMHIDWQHELLSGLRTVNPDCQFVVATHSPEIMARISDKDIFRL